MSFPHKHPPVTSLCAPKNQTSIFPEQHLHFKPTRINIASSIEMRPSFYTALALVVGGLQASALPTNDRLSVDLESPGETGLSNLDERAIDWWPATNCVSHLAMPQETPNIHLLTHPTTDLMHRNLPRRLRNPRLVVRRH